MTIYDWLVIGGGITGASLAYELQSQLGNVLLIDPNPHQKNATQYSYGGLPFWLGTSQETRDLCAEGMKIHRQLPEILDDDTEFQEINLLLTIRNDESPEELLKNYQDCEIPPQLLNVEETCELEPLLNPSAIAGAIYFPHGHINPKKTNQAYLKTFTRIGGTTHEEAVNTLLTENEKVVGVQTTNHTYYADNIVVCAGGFTRHLLQQVGIKIPVYFTHAELLETPPLKLNLNSLIMPANDQRLTLERESTTAEKELLWDESEQEIASAVIDPGVVQFRDRHLCMGQITRTMSDPNAEVDPASSQSWLRQEIGKLLPPLKNVPAQWHHCLIAFTPNSQASVGKVDDYEGIYVFSGFTSTLLFAPPLAKRFVASIKSH